MNVLYTQLLLTIFFITIVFLHLAKKNSSSAVLYGVQSLSIVLLLINSFLQSREILLLLIIVLVLVVKVILAPLFIINLIKKFNLKSFLVTTYVNVPLTLIVVTILTALAHSGKLSSLVNIIPANKQLLSLALSALFISLFLIVNRKGAFSQIIGILSLENSIVAFALFSGLEQAPALQIGVIFDISIWIIIATIFISMIYKHFGSLDVTEMQHLKD